MAIYDYQGNPINTAFDYQGDALNAAYDYQGNSVMESRSGLRIMSYNVQDYKGINSQSAMQNAIIQKYEADIVGVQEFCTNGVVPTIARNMFSDYDYLQLTNHKNYCAIASKLGLTGITVADYVHQDPEDLSRYNETRAYIKAYINYNGQSICLINTHLCYLTASIKWQQMMELFDIAEEEDNVIIVGDFNNMALSTSENDYLEMFKPFVDAGYKLANCSPSTGFTKTFGNVTTAETLNDLETAPDTIIVSPSLNISDVVVDTTKFDYLNGSVIDHVPIVCTVDFVTQPD